MKWIVRILGGLLAAVALAVGGLALAGLRPSHGRIDAQVDVACPRELVFRWITEDDLLKQWIGGMGKIEPMTPGKTGLGSRWRMTEGEHGATFTMNVEVTAFHAPDTIAIRVTSADPGPDGFEEDATYTLAETSGGTHLLMSTRSDYHGFMPRLFEPVITPSAKKTLDEDLQRLKKLAETTKLEEPSATAN